MTKRALLFAGLIPIALAAPAMALEVGDKAPEVHGSKWYNSKSPVTLAKLKGQIVLIDFWATW